MINREDYLMIEKARDKGSYLEDIADDVGCSVSTVKQALKRQGPPPKRKTGARISKLESFKPMVNGLIAENVWNVEVIFSQIREQGYTGGISILRDYIRPRRSTRKCKASARYETLPGHQLQHDWGELMTEVAGELRKVYFSVNTLGFSRRFFAWAAFTNDAEHTYESLIRSFEWFGGISAQVLVDNQKAAVLKHPCNGKVQFNEGFLMLAKHYQFQPLCCGYIRRLSSCYFVSCIRSKAVILLTMRNAGQIQSTLRAVFFAHFEALCFDFSRFFLVLGNIVVRNRRASNFSIREFCGLRNGFVFGRELALG